MRKKYYISGPMTGIPGHNFRAFDDASSRLEALGHTVVSPADIARKAGISETTVPDAASLLDIKYSDLQSLRDCEALYMLKDWENSEGARVEHLVARWLNLPIEYEVEVTAGNDPKGAVGKTKAPMWLLPPFALEETAWVHGLGADKYGPYNWRTTNVCASTYISAVLRHLLLGWASGEDNDKESKKSHLAHVAACVNILMDAQKTGTLVDDRATDVREIVKTVTGSGTVGLFVDTAKGEGL